MSQPTSLSRQIALRIRTLRQLGGLTQQQLAEKSGRSLEAISSIERGINSPTMETLKQLSIALNVSMADLIPAEEAGEKDHLLAELTGIAREMPLPVLEIAVRQIKVLSDLK
jgi:transcriptional regulator with XRE-family HTH domain